MIDPILAHPSASFDKLGLSELTMRAIRDVAYTLPTPVQAGAIPIALTGKDVLVQSQTGTGKTAAFSLPLIEQICGRLKRKGVQALILTPTRELARQVAHELSSLAKYHQLTICTVYGGTAFDPQVMQLKTADLVVGTPGRIIDHLKRGTLSLEMVRHFVLDEADEMLSMGFAEELEEIRKRLPKQRQTLFFSATFPPAVKRYSERTLKEPVLLSFLDESSSADDLDHGYYMVKGLARSTPLTKILLSENPENAIIFVNTRKDCDLVVKALKRVGLDADRLSGDMDQKERERVMAKMKRKALRYLVATDVAARGIDISQLSHVIHYQLPDSPEVYIHRSGRTGRAGEKGVVLSLVGPQEIGVLYALKRFHHLKLIERELPQIKIHSEHIVKPATPPKPESVADLSKNTRNTSQTITHSKPEQQTQSLTVSKTKSKGRLSYKKDLQKASDPSEPDASQHMSPEGNSVLSPEVRLYKLLNEVQAVYHPDVKNLAQSILNHDRTLDLICLLLAKISSGEQESPKSSLPKADAQMTLTKRVPLDSLLVNIGRQDVSHVQALKELLAELGGLLPEDISSVQMRKSSSRIEISREFSADLIEALHGEPYAGRVIEIKLMTL